MTSRLLLTKFRFRLWLCKWIGHNPRFRWDIMTMLCHRCGLVLMTMEAIDMETGKPITPEAFTRKVRERNATRAREGFRLMSSSSETKKETSDTSANAATSSCEGPESA